MPKDEDTAASATAKVPPVSRYPHSERGDTTTAIQDYIKAIFKLQDGSAGVTNTAIAEKLGYTPASVTGMLKKLARAELVTHHPYQGVVLTEKGRRLALEMIRHHRLIELYLMRALGYSWDEVDAEAERLEHVISEEMEDRMAAFLQEPTEDPHGDPIPTRDGVMSTIRYAPLATMQPGQFVRIRRVKDSDPSLLRYLGQLGLYPHVVLEVVDRAPFDGPLTIRISSAQHALGPQVANSVFVEPVREGAS